MAGYRLVWQSEYVLGITRSITYDLATNWWSNSSSRGIKFPHPLAYRSIRMSAAEVKLGKILERMNNAKRSAQNLTRAINQSGMDTQEYRDCMKSFLEAMESLEEAVGSP